MKYAREDVTRGRTKKLKDTESVDKKQMKLKSEGIKPLHEKEIASSDGGRRQDVWGEEERNLR